MSEFFTQRHHSDKESNARGFKKNTLRSHVWLDINHGVQRLEQVFHWGRGIE